MSHLEYNKLFVHDHINARELSEVYFSDASERGQLFLILETPKNKINQQPMIDQIIEALTHHFISSPQDDPELLLEEKVDLINENELNKETLKNDFNIAKEELNILKTQINESKISVNQSNKESEDFRFLSIVLGSLLAIVILVNLFRAFTRH